MGTVVGKGTNVEHQTMMMMMMMTMMRMENEE